MNFNIALLQLIPSDDLQKNRAIGIEACKKAKALGADLALFPEVWQLGYDTKKLHKQCAITKQDDFVKTFISLAKELNMAIAITFLLEADPLPKNVIYIIDCNGNVVLEYAKVHICDFKDGTEQQLSSGDRFLVTKLQYATGEVHIGAMICMDREFCESTRTLSLMGAELIIIPNACPMATCETLDDVRIAALRGLAFENLVGVALTNYPAPIFDGHSCAFDNLGKEVAMANHQESIIIATFDLDTLRQIRSEEWECRGAPARKPSAYAL